MARKKISEYAAKNLLYRFLDTPYTGISIHSSQDLEKIQTLSTEKTYVVKVDEGVKGRFKKGLVLLDVTKEDIPASIKKLEEKGYTQFLVEEFYHYKAEEEHYLAIERVREGYKLLYSEKGGIAIEEHVAAVQEKIFTTKEGIESVATELHLDPLLLLNILEVFDAYYFSFLEINPFIKKDNRFIPVDLAVEVDSAGAFFVQNGWKQEDMVEEGKDKTKEEKNIDMLSSKSQASFKLNMLHTDGSLFMLLSGGGASLVVADEAYNLGFGKEVANYGEYSGNPTEEETYIYTKNLLQLLLQSSAKQKMLIIAGGVANFTDVRITFRGIIKALDEVKETLQQEEVKVYVRRGGPNQEEGLAMMKEFLTKEQLYGQVSGPEIVLTDVVKNAVALLEK